MENNRIVYKSFAKLAVAIAVAQGASLTKAKKLIIKSFDRHPYQEDISKIVKKVKLEKENLNILSNNCISICEDFGPDRDYVTLVSLLENIYQIEEFE